MRGPRAGKAGAALLLGLMLWCSGAVGYASEPKPQTGGLKPEELPLNCPRLELPQGCQVLPSNAGKGQPGEPVQGSDGLCCGLLYDYRYGELLLGANALRCTKATLVLLNGVPIAIEQISQYLSSSEEYPHTKHTWAYAQYSKRDGVVKILDIIEPQQRKKAEPIQSFTCSSQEAWDNGADPLAGSTVRSYRAGTRLSFRLKAVGGARVAFRIIGYPRELPALEVKPGFYRAEFLVPSGLNLPNTYALAYWQEKELPRNSKSHNQPKRFVQLGECLTLAATGPLIKGYGPTAATAFSPVFVQYQSLASYIPASKVRFWLDGVELTAKAQSTTQVCCYWPDGKERPALAPGQHRARVRLWDAAGNTTEHAWSFRVQ